MQGERWAGSWPSTEELRRISEATLGSAPSEESATRLLEFARLLERWAARFNLVSAKSRGEVVERHVVDSLALVELIEPAASLGDLGSGAGFPGIPLAIVLPDMAITLIEPRRHRANFLREAKRRLLLDNLSVDERSGDHGGGFPAIDVVTGRAVREDVLVAFAGRVLSDGGRLLLMTKASTEPSRPHGFAVGRTREYRLGNEPHHVRELVRRFT